MYNIFVLKCFDIPLSDFSWFYTVMSEVALANRGHPCTLHFSFFAINLTSLAAPSDRLPLFAIICTRYITHTLLGTLSSICVSDLTPKGDSGGVGSGEGVLGRRPNRGIVATHCVQGQITTKLNHKLQNVFNGLWMTYTMWWYLLELMDCQSSITAPDERLWE